MELAEKAQALAHKFAEIDDEARQLLAQALTARGDVVVPALRLLMLDASLLEPDGLGEGDIPYFCAEQLEAIGTPLAVEALLDGLLAAPPGDPFGHNARDYLRPAGGLAFELGLARLDEPLDATGRLRLGYLLSSLVGDDPVRDPRLLALGLQVLAEHPTDGAFILADLGDPAALPDLQSALASVLQEPAMHLEAREATAAIWAAIEELGGSLSLEQTKRIAALDAEFERRHRRHDARLGLPEAGPGRRQVSAKKRKSKRKAAKKSRRKNR